MVPPARPEGLAPAPAAAATAEVAEATTADEAAALWQRRIALLYQGIRLNRDNADYNARGQSFDLALASTD